MSRAFNPHVPGTPLTVHESAYEMQNAAYRTVLIGTNNAAYCIPRAILFLLYCAFFVSEATRAGREKPPNPTNPT